MKCCNAELLVLIRLVSNPSTLTTYAAYVLVKYELTNRRGQNKSSTLFITSCPLLGARVFWFCFFVLFFNVCQRFFKRSQLSVCVSNNKPLKECHHNNVKFYGADTMRFGKQMSRRLLFIRRHIIITSSSAIF